MVVAGAAWDLATAGDAARERNAAIRPVIGRHQALLSLDVRF